METIAQKIVNKYGEYNDVIRRLGEVLFSYDGLTYDSATGNRLNVNSVFYQFKDGSIIEECCGDIYEVCLNCLSTVGCSC